MSREIKVGLLVVGSLAVLALAVFSVGERSNFFTRESQYFVRFETVGGLASGSPVHLNGVGVGTVDRVVLPEDPADSLLTVWISIDRKYDERVRGDSSVRIKTLGLLGDKFVAITSGTAAEPAIGSGGEIPAAPATDVEQLIATGEDVVDNVVAISASLQNILSRMEAGEGILGELLTDAEAGRHAKTRVLGILDSLDNVSKKIEGGQGALAKLVNDRDLANRIESVVTRLEGVLGALETGEGVLPALLHDRELRDSITGTVGKLDKTIEELSVLVADLGNGEGLLAKLLSDGEFAEQVGQDLEQVMENLNSLTSKLDRGEGTVAKLVNDPAVYEALDDILVGIDESKLLRWLIRNRQKKGIKERHEAEQEVLELDAGASPGGEAVTGDGGS